MVSIHAPVVTHLHKSMQDVDAKDEADAIDALLSAADRPGMGASGIVSGHCLYPGLVPVLYKLKA